MLSYLSNSKNYSNDYVNNLSNSNNNIPLMQMFQYLQTQGGSMNNLLQSITNNNTAFQSNRMNNSYLDPKGNFKFIY